MKRFRDYVMSWVESRRLWRNAEWRRQIAESEADWERDKAAWLEADSPNHADEDIALGHLKFYRSDQEFLDSL